MSTQYTVKTWDDQECPNCEAYITLVRGEEETSNPECYCWRCGHNIVGLIWHQGMGVFEKFLIDINVGEPYLEGVQR